MRNWEIMTGQESAAGAKSGSYLYVMSLTSLDRECLIFFIQGFCINRSKVDEVL